MTQTSPSKSKRTPQESVWLAIKILVVANVVTLLIAVSAGYFALRDQVNRLDTIQSSRIDSRYDSCNLLKNLVTEAAPASQQQSLQAYIASTPLANCNTYSRQDVNVTGTSTTLKSTTSDTGR